MACRRCGQPLDRPGDYCLSCDTDNTDAVVADIQPDRASLTFLWEDEIKGQTDIPTTPEDENNLSIVQIRNFAGRIADEIRRKRPDAVYVTGDRNVIQSLRADIRYPVYRVPERNPVEAVLSRRGESELDVVEKSAREKIGGSHTTVIGGREGQRAIQTIAAHPNVKKIVPGPIDASGTGSQSGTRAKVTRSDTNGNVRLLIRNGSSIQENRVVTTARDRNTGERLREDLNEALADEGLQEQEG
ncbi:MAG: DUF2103 domain-containing protein [Halodesulfurarchaeum sp.]